MLNPIPQRNTAITALLALSLTALIGCGGNHVSVNVPATNMVVHWNHVSVDASGYDHSLFGAHENLGPTKASRATAIAAIAVHDAIQAIQRRYETYLPQDPAPSDASIEAAVATAAHDSLAALYPSQKAQFDQQMDEDLATIPNGAQKASGIVAGQKAAAAILSNRANDGSDAATQGQAYSFGQQPGEWRADPINPNQHPLGANWSLVRPFVMTSAHQFRADPPPALGSKAYADAYREVARLGGDGVTTPTDRNKEQTRIGIFWAYDGTPSLCAPPRLYNQLIMHILKLRGVTDLGDTARVLALANIAMADAGIAAWETKYYYNLWRPITGIRESDPGTGPTGLGDGNAQTKGNSTWTPLGAPASNLSANNFTPPFPAYVSGHATFGGAIFEVLREYFGRDDIPFTFVSDEFNGITLDNSGQIRPLLPRSFRSLSQAEEENGQSRIYLGIHWSFDKTEGIKMGNRVAAWTVSHLLRPIH